MNKYYELRPLTKCLKANISIQCGKYHHSDPQEYLENIQDYSKVEIALFTKGGEWIQPRSSKTLEDFPRLLELIDYYETGTCPVGFYVPLDLVNSLIEYLNKEPK